MLSNADAFHMNWPITCIRSKVCPTSLCRSAQWSSSIKDGTKPGMPLMFESTPGSYSYGELGVSPSETDSVNNESDVGADNGNVPRKACYRAEEVAE